MLQRHHQKSKNTTPKMGTFSFMLTKPIYPYENISFLIHQDKCVKIDFRCWIPHTSFLLLFTWKKFDLLLIVLPIRVAKYSFSIKIPESTYCPDLCSLSLMWIVTVTQGLLACLPCLTLDSSIPVQELGFQSISGRVIPGQERTNWEQLLSNETIIPNRSENRGYPVKDKWLKEQEK